MDDPPLDTEAAKQGLALISSSLEKALTNIKSKVEEIQTHFNKIFSTNMRIEMRSDTTDKTLVSEIHPDLLKQWFRYDQLETIISKTPSMIISHAQAVSDSFERVRKPLLELIRYNFEFMRKTISDWAKLIKNFLFFLKKLTALKDFALVCKVISQENFLDYVINTFKVHKKKSDKDLEEHIIGGWVRIFKTQQPDNLFNKVIETRNKRFLTRPNYRRKLDLREKLFPLSQAPTPAQRKLPCVSQIVSEYENTLQTSYLTVEPYTSVNTAYQTIFLNPEFTKLISKVESLPNVGYTLLTELFSQIIEILENNYKGYFAIFRAELLKMSDEGSDRLTLTNILEKYLPPNDLYALLEALGLGPNS